MRAVSRDNISRSRSVSRAENQKEEEIESEYPASPDRDQAGTRCARCRGSKPEGRKRSGCSQIGQGLAPRVPWSFELPRTTQEGTKNEGRNTATWDLRARTFLVQALGAQQSADPFSLRVGGAVIFFQRSNGYLTGLSSLQTVDRSNFAGVVRQFSNATVTTFGWISSLYCVATGWLIHRVVV